MCCDLTYTETDWGRPIWSQSLCRTLWGENLVLFSVLRSPTHLVYRYRWVFVSVTWVRMYESYVCKDRYTWSERV